MIITDIGVVSSGKHDRIVIVIQHGRPFDTVLSTAAIERVGCPETFLSLGFSFFVMWSEVQREPSQCEFEREVRQERRIHDR